MKKVIFGIIAATGMLLATSCQNDELETIQSGNEATVSFSLGVEGGVQTRAISDGTGANELHYRVFQEDGTPVSNALVKEVKKVDSYPYEVEMTLAKGQTYKVAFWAQNEACDAYTVDENMNLTIDYAGVNNDEKRDAFFKTETITVTGNATIPVVLKRPFAQINVGVTNEDWNAATELGINIQSSKVVIKNAATSMNLIDGSVDDETEVTYALGATPKSTNEVLEVDLDGDGTPTEYNYLSMSYILVNDANGGAQKANLDEVEFTFKPDDNTKNDIVFGLNNVPVQRNYRTNIIGQILTGKITHSISIEQRFDDDYNFLYPDGDEDEDADSNVKFVTNASELQNALNNAKDGSVIYFTNDITGDVTATQKSDVKISILGQGYKLNGMLTVDGQNNAYSTAGLTIKNVNFAAETITGDACIRLGDGTGATNHTSNVTVDNCTFDVSGAVGVKSYTGGDKNLTITNCTATVQTHSLVQAKGIDGISAKDCYVYSKNGMNFNSSTNVTIDGCTVDVKGYAVCFGESSGGAGEAEVYSIKNSTLKSTNDEGSDAVIVLRDTADKATLTIKNTTLEGTPEIQNTATDVIIIVDDVATVSSADGLAKVVKMGYTTINLEDGNYDVKECNGKTLILNGSTNAVLTLMNEDNVGGDSGFSNSNVTFNGLTIDNTSNTGNYKGYVHMSATFNGSNFVGAYCSFENSTFNNCTFDFKDGYFWTWGATTLTFDSCTFNGNSKAILAHGDTSTTININDCVFAATEKGYTYGGDHTAVVEIDPTGSNTYTVNFTGTNTKTEHYAGWYRIKDDSTGHTITGVD